MSIKSLDTQIDQFVINSKAKMAAVMRGAIADTVEESQTPVAKGGKMRVDTGFLRNSGVAALNAAPVGPIRGRRRLPGETGVLPEYRYEGETLTQALAKMQIGDVFFFGWTARYAKIRETYDGFLESALQNWQTNVNRWVQKFRDKDMRL